MTDTGVVVWYNPRCSKCRGAEELLAACGVPARRVRYLDDPPAREEITRVLTLLGATDPRALMRTGEPRYRELGLAEATADQLVEAMAWPSGSKRLTSTRWSAVSRRSRRRS